MKACEFQSDNYKLHCGIHVLSRELRGWCARSNGKVQGD